MCDNLVEICHIQHGLSVMPMKKKRFSLLVIGTLVALASMHAQDLRFKNGRFKIAQLTDIHWEANSPQNEKNFSILYKVLQEEKPDLAIITGDVVTAQPAQQGWKDIISIFENTQIPFAVTMGNHDYEEWSEDSIYNLLAKSSLFVGEKGPKDLSGTGNYILPIKASDGTNQIKSLLYCLDSHAYPENEQWGHYDWIHLDQVNWYRNESRHFTELAGMPLPSLAFFHIALPEFRELKGKDTTFGVCNEDSGSPRINSGLFSQFLECRDVMGAFVGHDHDIDYIGQYYNVALAYGRVSGLDAYGDLERGIRMISLYEDDFRFDTWITTSKGKEPTYYYPSGITSKMEEEATYMKAKIVNPSKKGISYTYYEGRFKHTDHMKTKGQKTSEGVMPFITIEQAPAKDHFGYDFRGLIQVPATGVYNFSCYSDDGSMLYIDGQLVVDNNGSHSAERNAGRIALDKGFHDIQVLYFEDYMGEELKVFVSSKDIKEQPLPSSWLFVGE